MRGYSAKVENTIKELTAKEKIMMKDTSNAIKLDEAIEFAEDQKVVIDIDNVVTLAIHNEKAQGDDKDYEQYVIVDKNGTKFVTGSESFITSLTDILEEMYEAGEKEVRIEAYAKDSKNYKGKHFLTCSVL